MARSVTYRPDNFKEFRLPYGYRFRCQYSILLIYEDGRWVTNHCSRREMDVLRYVRDLLERAIDNIGCVMHENVDLSTLRTIMYTEAPVVLSVKDTGDILKKSASFDGQAVLLKDIL